MTRGMHFLEKDNMSSPLGDCDGPLGYCMPRSFGLGCLCHMPVESDASDTVSTLGFV